MSHASGWLWTRVYWVSSVSRWWEVAYQKRHWPFQNMLPWWLMTSCELHVLCHFVFQNFELHHQEVMGLFSNEIMCAINTGVAGISVKMLSMFPSIVRSTRNWTMLLKSPYISSIDLAPNMPPYRLLLKKLCSVMLLRNLDPVNGHCNGTWYTLQEINAHVLDAVVATHPNYAIRQHYPF